MYLSIISWYEPASYSVSAAFISLSNADKFGSVNSTSVNSFVFENTSFLSVSVANIFNDSI